MSRIGKKPVSVPSGVEVRIEGPLIQVKGPKGTRGFTCPGEISICMEEDTNRILIQPIGKTKRAKQMWGMARTQVQNLMDGVTNGFHKKLEISGVGYRAQAQGNVLKMTLGFSHDVEFAIPQGIEIKTPKPTEIEIYGIDQQQVGQVAAKIRDWRRPEPYKGKGIRYANEYIFRKAGKKK